MGKIVTTSPQIEVEFLNDRSGRDLYFSADAPFPTIVAPTRWSQWNCGKANENNRCADVRNGKFLWNGVYQIDFTGGFRGALVCEDGVSKGKCCNVLPGYHAKNVFGGKAQCPKNDSISGITVAPGCKVTAYQHYDFSGNKWT